MKSVLCYGDSNTYGYSPINGNRFSEGVRWTSILAGLLGEEYRVIEEGCNGRTTVLDDPYEAWKNGLTYLKPCLNTHKPVDIVIIMLGTNDLKTVFGVSAKEIASGVDTLVKTVIDFTKDKQEHIPEIIVVGPPKIGEDIESSVFGGSFDYSAVIRSKEFPVLYGGVAEENGCRFFDASKVVEPSKEDSLHLDSDGHRKLAEALYNFLI